MQVSFSSPPSPICIIDLPNGSTIQDIFNISKIQPNTKQTVYVNEQEITPNKYTSFVLQDKQSIRISSYKIHMGRMPGPIPEIDIPIGYTLQNALDNNSIYLNTKEKIHVNGIYINPKQYNNLLLNNLDIILITRK